MTDKRKDSKGRVLRHGESQRTDGRYMYRYQEGGETRTVYSWTLTANDRQPKGKKAGLPLRELEKQIQRDITDGIVTSDKQTLNDLFAAYMANRIDLKPKTRISYTSMYNTHVRDSIGVKRVSCIKSSDIKALYLSMLHDKGLAIGTVTNIQKILHSLFDIALQDDIIRKNPSSNVVSQISKGINGTEKKRALSREQQKAFLQFVSSSQVYRKYFALFTFLLGTGCRIGEATGLTWNDCDFDNDVISINHILNYYSQDGKYSFHIGTPKTKSSIRTIPMLPEIKRVLQQERERQEQKGYCQAVIDGYSGFVFVNTQNKPFPYQNINMTLDRIVKSYNEQETAQAAKDDRNPLLLPSFSVHVLRHTFCTRYCETETNLKTIQTIMGHSSITTTMDIYNETTQDTKLESFTAISGKMGLL